MRRLTSGKLPLDPSQVPRRPLKSDKPPAHVLIRVRAENGRTFTEHKRLIEKSGTAILGKMGQPIGPDFTKELNEQIRAGKV